jgi:hypothetical protein
MSTMKKKSTKGVITYMSGETSKLLEDIVRRRAERLGISESEVLEESRKEQSSLREIIKRSEETGRSALDLLQEELDSTKESDYPGPECLLPHELELLQTSGKLDDSRMEHLNTCDSCRALTSAMTPTRQHCEEFAEAVQRHTASALTCGQSW